MRFRLVARNGVVHGTGSCTERGRARNGVVHGTGSERSFFTAQMVISPRWIALRFFEPYGKGDVPKMSKPCAEIGDYGNCGKTLFCSDRRRRAPAWTLADESTLSQAPGPGRLERYCPGRCLRRRRRTMRKLPKPKSAKVETSGIAGGEN